MKPSLTHPWPKDRREAEDLQRKLAALVVEEDRLGPVQKVAGVDLGFFRPPGQPERARAVVAVLSFPELKLVDHGVAEMPVTFPYIPGLLAFREAPAALAAFEKIGRPPDLVLVDGQGRAHPRRFGIACHLGVVLDIPTIGCAKSRLVGVPQGELGQEAGDWVPLLDDDETVGAVVRTKAGANPVYVSVGHRISLATAIEYVLRCCRGLRLPEPIRWAHNFASGVIPLPASTEQNRGAGAEQLPLL